MNLVVAYDIPNDRRRTRVFKVLKNFGQWMQFSVFECHVTERDLVELRHRLDEEIDPKEDSIRIYRLCDACMRSVERIGGEPVRDGGPIIL